MKIKTLLECNLGSLSMIRSFSPCTRHQGRNSFSKTASITFPSMLSCSKCRLLMILNFYHWGQGRKWIPASKSRLSSSRNWIRWWLWTLTTSCRKARRKPSEKTDDGHVEELFSACLRESSNWSNSKAHSSNARDHESNYRRRWGEDFVLISSKMWVGAFK